MSPWEPHSLLSSAGTLASSIFSHPRQLTGVSWSPRGNYSHSSWPGVPTPQPKDPQHSSALGTWVKSLTVRVKHLQHFYHHCTALCDMKTLGSITHRGVDGKMHMCQLGTGSAAWAKEKTMKSLGSCLNHHEHEQLAKASQNFSIEHSSSWPSQGFIILYWFCIHILEKYY